MEKKLSIIIKTSQDYIRHFGDFEKSNAILLNIFFDNISDVYIPLLRMVNKLQSDGLKCRFGLVLPPLLCNLFADVTIQDSYIGYLEKRIILGQKELSRAEDDKVREIIKATIEKYESLKKDFTEKYNKDLIAAFTECMKNGYIELLGTCGTDLFIPHYADLKEIISAQIESGLHAYKQFFGTVPEGFWLPAFGYMTGVEKLIKAYGYSYTVLDARSLLFSENCPDTGIFYPVRTDNSLVVLARDSRLPSQITGENGYSRNCLYRNENRDIGYELTPVQLEPVVEIGSARYATGYKYWNRCFENSDKAFYDRKAALEQAHTDAAAFVEEKSKLLDQAAEALPESDYVSYVCAFESEELFRNWNESVEWLEYVIRTACEKGLTIVSGDQLLEKQYSLTKFNPYYSAGIGDGYGENLLSSKNCWMIRHIRKACERMIDLSDRFPNDTGLKTRLLNLGAKELMLAQSLMLAKAIDNSMYPELAERRFRDSINAFTAVFDSLGSNTVSTEWLTTMEMQDAIFPWMNYRIFSKKH
ncbi:MAG: DUF1957 domain-containing protein [Treponema sp.]|nr:DUF1957 domain-containing protein [Treponema sp.]